MRNQINIKGQKYKLILKNVESYLIENEEVCGTCDFKNKEITLAINTDEVELNARIFHELIHAYLRECGLHEKSKDEQLVDWFAYAMLGIIENFNTIKKKIKS